ncbi:Pimeloyl-ACP methyl ester carboxylesterase [Halogeometricum rufum]|uniref:Pimeloyl-ACP methyl ester carboxylesterase n=1 Tax=Halogeometricum rufum TaxID=553469 RepID=A0A1I6HPY1_9EURY|nr:alpha/beta hydrolase [Halogeometricum rufum]SFR56330.1 Pimeloyl-ACP methyl ester carboxylesterase [Halogeometricum rufum]
MTAELRASDDADAPEAGVSTVTVGDGRHVAYAEYGDPEGVPVVFLHGTPGSRRLAALFDDAARRAGVRVLAIDRPGYGRSSPWPGRTLRDTGAFVTAVLDDAGVTRAGVVGFSGGGPHALAVAATHGERVRRVDVVAGAVPPSLASSKPAALRAFEVLAAATPTLARGLARVQSWVAARASPSAVVSQYTADGADVPDDVAELVRRDFVEAFARHRSGFVAETRLLSSEWDVAVESVTVPVRFWHGDRDTNVPVAGARRLADRLPNATLTTFEDADHLRTLLRAREAVFDRDGATADESAADADAVAAADSSSRS